jgi:hypothetical protein
VVKNRLDCYNALAVPARLPASRSGYASWEGWTAGKSLREVDALRCLTPFLIVALLAAIALAGYNTWQIDQLRKELAAKPGAARSEKRAKSDKEIADLVDQAKRQTESARGLISGGKLKNAQDELNKSVQKLEKASKLSKDMAEQTYREMTGAVESLKNAFGSDGKKQTEDGADECM